MIERGVNDGERRRPGVPYDLTAARLLRVHGNRPIFPSPTRSDPALLPYLFSSARSTPDVGPPLDTPTPSTMAASAPSPSTNRVAATR